MMAFTLASDRKNAAEGHDSMAASDRIVDRRVARLVSITRSPTEPASRVDRARMLLAYRENASFFAVARALGVHHQTAGSGLWPDGGTR
jgi:hypothetical protein